MQFEQLTRNEGPRLRSIRLRALQDAPDAFGTTFEEASATPAEAWANQLANLPTFVAVEDGRDVAMVRCARDQQNTEVGWLISMWVAPDCRRAHLGSVLVDLVVAWARANGMGCLRLDVADVNAPAVALYESKGFMPNGKNGSMSSPRQHIREHQRELRLR
jgi:GNAT superfamily N-acetyltransferase